MVEIPDVEPEVFQELLRYIYTDQLPNKQLDEIVVELLAVAYKCCPNFVLTSHRYENHEAFPSLFRKISIMVPTIIAFANP